MSVSRLMAEQVKQSEDTIGSLGKPHTQLFFFPLVTCSCSNRSLRLLSHLLQDGAGNQRGVQKHDRNHSPGEETHPEVQPTGADGQTAHLSGAGSVLRHSSLHPEETPFPLHLTVVQTEASRYFSHYGFVSKNGLYEDGLMGCTCWFNSTRSERAVTAKYCVRYTVCQTVSGLCYCLQRGCRPPMVWTWWVSGFSV